MKDYPETHTKGIATVDFDKLEYFGYSNCDFGIKIEGGRVWICINGQSVLRFKTWPLPKIDKEE